MKTEKIDISDIDTIVIPAREDGFQEAFIDENCWYAIRLNSFNDTKNKVHSRIPGRSISAITHIVEVKSIEQWKDTNKYILHFCWTSWKIKKYLWVKLRGKHLKVQDILQKTES